MPVMPVQGSRLSYADLERMPDDGKRYELYDGEAVVVPAPVPRHQLAAQSILRALTAYAAKNGGAVLISPIDIVFTDHDVLQPDIVFFTAERAHLIDPDRAIRDAPDLAVEVLSPSTAARDRGRKKEMFARFGVPEYWIVDPKAETIEVYALIGKEYHLEQCAEADGRLRSLVLPELELELAEAFRGLRLPGSGR
jgi:Uma2 family endonuclease